MRNDIFEMRKDPARKAEAEKLLVGRSASANVSISPDAWHEAAIEVVGDRMRVTLDGNPAGSLQSPGHRPRDQDKLSLHRQRAGGSFRRRAHLEGEVTQPLGGAGV